MNFEKSKKIVIDVISKITKKNLKITDNFKLIGDDSPMDSLKLVEMCIMLEDSAEEHGFQFLWTSSSTMSKTNSIFRDIDTLAKEFSLQSKG